MSTLITGGHGLLGSFMNFGLKPNRHELDINNFTDICNYVEQNKIDSIIHAAAKVGGVKANTDYVFDYFSENILMNMNIMNVCKKYSIKNATFVVSTCAFPKNAPLPLNEDYLHGGEPHETNYGYAYAKRMLEVGSRALKYQCKLNSCCLIPCNLYGGNDNYNLQSGHVIPSLIHKCYLAKLNNTTFEVWGSGKAEREFMYAEDLAIIIEQIHKNNLSINEPLIVSPNNIFTIEEIVNMIVKKMKFNGRVFFDASKPEGIMKKNSSSDRLQKYFPNFKFTNLEDGLETTVCYFLKNYNTIRK
jgi:GDP-L-fucose synthase